MIPVHDVLRSAAFLLSLDGDRHTMLIGTADIEDILTPHPQVPHIDVCRHIYTGQVTDVHRTVRVWKCAGHQRSVEFLCHILLYF